MFTTIIVIIMSLVMWVLGALIISDGISDEISSKSYFRKLSVVLLSVPIIPWLKGLDRIPLLAATFFYVISILGIISLFV